MKIPKRTRNGGTFKQSDYEWIKRLQGLGVDRAGAHRATGWSLDTVGRVFRANSFEDYRQGSTTAQSIEKATPETQLPLSIPETTTPSEMSEVLTVLKSINNQLAILVEQTANHKRGWLR